VINEVNTTGIVQREEKTATGLSVTYLRISMGPHHVVAMYQPLLCYWIVRS
jgi:hypothetical protein